MSSSASSSADEKVKTNVETSSNGESRVPVVSASSGNDSAGSQSANSSSDNNVPFRTYRKSDSNESGGSGGSGGSNHSSGMLSIGNTSFGFNFDSDPMMHLGGSSAGVPSEKTSEGESSDNNEKQQHKYSSTDADAAADANVANLQSLARSQDPQHRLKSESPRKRNGPDPPQHEQSQQPQQVQYHYYDQPNQNDESVASRDNDEEDEEDDNQSRSTTEPRSSNDSPQPKRRKKRLDERKRVERNAREKERSFRISKQINELRSLLSSGGVIVPKGTKSSVLTEAANYIRMLQQHQYRSEM